jgi:amphi-Trp domain-containing protein
MSDERFEYESFQDSESIKAYFQSLVEGLENGRIILSSEGKEIMLRPGPLLKFTVKAKKKDDSCKFSVKITWKEKKKEKLAMGEPMNISS